jgi:hypothetical protein
MAATMEAKRAQGDAVKLDTAALEKIDESKVRVGKKEESAEVSAQWNGWVVDPYDHVPYHFSFLNEGAWNMLRDPFGRTWLQWID